MAEEEIIEKETTEEKADEKEELQGWQKDLEDYTPGGGLAGVVEQYTADEEEEEDGKSKEKNKEEKEKPEKEGEDDGSEDDDEGEEKDDGGDEEDEGVAGTSQLEKMEKPLLIAEVTKHQTIANNFKKEKEDLQVEVATLKKQVKEQVDPVTKKFLEGLKTDPLGTWKEMSDELKLPDVTLLKAQIESGDIDTQVAYFQESVLKKEVEKKFNLDEGTFRFDSDEASDAKSPSYYWLRRTRDHEEELRAKIKEMNNKQKEILESSKKSQSEDREWYAKTFYDGDVSKADEAIRHLNEIPKLIHENKLTPNDHPFALRTLLLGVNFEALKKQAVDNAVKAVEEAYQSKGIYLKEGEMPTDITKIPSAGTGRGKSKSSKNLNPAESALEQYR